MADFPDLFDELERVPLGLLGSIRDGGETAVKKHRVAPRPITANFSLKVGFLDSANRDDPKVNPAKTVQAPLIDVIDEKDALRVIVLLPGIGSKDVKVGVRDGLLRIEITKGGATYSREIPCKLAPSDIRVKSVVERNSVVEILFSKVGKARSSE
jgi:HSP20 family molecular chaperone IbpA